jgi:sporulation protein YlmC with PRC-barrel domain
MTQPHEGFSKYWTPKQFMGKVVFDSKGQDCGKIQSLYIDSQTFSMSGVMAKKRLGKEYFISRGYFENMDELGLHLNSIPIKPNDKVVDTEGRDVGKVIKINLNSETNKLESLEVKSGFKSRIVLSGSIVGVGEKITVKS